MRCRLRLPAAASFLLFTILLISPGCVRGAVYYVDSAAGDDARDGRREQAAWRTLAKVNGSAFQPGDSILLKRGGLWRETLEVPSSGAPEKPIVIGAYGEGERPVICGANVVAGWAREAGGVNVWSVVLAKAAPPQEEFDGHAFEGSGEAGVWLDGKRGKRVASKAALANAGDWCFDGYRLYIHSADDPAKAYTRPGVELPVRLEGIRLDKRGYAQRDRKWVVIDGLALTKIRRWAVDAINSDHVTVRRCLIEWVGPGNKWKDYANDPVAIGLNHNTSNALIEGNVMHDCGCGVYIGTAQPGYAARGNVVRGNEIYNVRSGINAKVHATGGVFEGNSIHDVATQGIRSVGDEKGGNLITRNYVARCEAEGIELRSHNTVAYNVVASCKLAPIIIISDAGETEDRINAGDDNVICNNVLYDTPLNSGVSFANPKGTDVRNNVIRNNLFVGIFLPVRFSGGIPEDGAGNVCDYNGYWNANPNSAYARQPGQMPLAEWQSKLGWDRHSIFADPKFVASKPVKAEDFRLQADSPCIDAGTDVGLKSDFADKPVPQGKGVDIGAFENR